MTKYVYGRGLIGEEMGGNFKTYHFDARGSTVAITSASGSITDTFAYDTYGKLLSRTGTSKVIFGYNGRDGVVTEDNGLIYMRARYYSPNMKRFINADIVAGKLSNAVTLNRFAYANGNPAVFIDPLGLRVVARELLSSTNNNASMSSSSNDIFDNSLVWETFSPSSSQSSTYRITSTKQASALYLSGLITLDEVPPQYSWDPAIWIPYQQEQQELQKAESQQNAQQKAGEWLNENARNKDGSYALHDNQRFDKDAVFHEQILAFTPSLPSWNWSKKNFSVGLGSLSLDAYTGGWEGEYVDLSLLDFGHAEAGFEVDKSGIDFGAFASIWSPSFSVTFFGVTIELGAEVGAVGLSGKAEWSGDKKSAGLRFGSAIGFSFNVSW